MNEKEKMYNEHSKFLADIALAVLEENKSVLDVNGVKEIIAFYLLIPYITPEQLKTPGKNYKIPKISGKFSSDIDYEDIRNTICHSFITVEEKKGIPGHGDHLIFDDRVKKSRKKHDEQDYHSQCTPVRIDYAHKKLISTFLEIQKQ